MLEQHPSKIFKVDFRTQLSTENYVCQSVLDESAVLDKLLAFNEETFGPSHHQEYVLEDDQTDVFLPLIGGFDLDQGDSSKFVHINQILVCSWKKGTTFSIKNPYEEEVIHLLQFRLASEGILSITKDFDFENKNRLNTVVTTKNFCLSVGIFGLRKEEEYQLKSNSRGIFAYVIKGAFEFQNRLLEDRDALAIWNVKTIELESLTENSLLFLIEILD